MKKIIEEKELADLLRAAEKLKYLEAGGIDNWEGYDISLNDITLDSYVDSYWDYEERPDSELTKDYQNYE